MVIQRYRIYELSARAVMSYATQENGIYKYDLDAGGRAAGWCGSRRRSGANHR